MPPTAEGTRLPRADLVIDAAYGTGFRGDYHAPDPGGAPVLAVDIPSGVNGLTGEAGDGAVTRRRDGVVRRAQARASSCCRAASAPVASTSSTSASTLEPRSLRIWSRRRMSRAGCPTRPARDPQVAGRGVDRRGLAGHDRRSGARRAVARSARVRATCGSACPARSAADATAVPIEVVRTELPSSAWDGPVLDGLERFKALVVGPGLGTEPATIAAVRRVVQESTVPSVVDGDGLTALGADVARYAHPLSVLTPHDGEYERLAGHPPGPDRIAAARDLAAIDAVRRCCSRARPRSWPTATVGSSCR